MIRGMMVGVAVALAVTTTAAQSTRGGSAKKAAASPAGRSSVQISVRDQNRAPLSGVHLILSGAAAGAYKTGAAGTTVIPKLKDGLYRVRCEHAGFITLEREFTVRGGAKNAIDVVLNPAQPSPGSAPSGPDAASASTAGPSGPPVIVSITDFLDRNFIGREPMRESVLACRPLEAVRLLQMREPVARHVHDRVDEIIYVVAGDGVLRLGENAITLRPATLAVVPHGSNHSFEIRGKKPLIAVSTLAGAACTPAPNAR
jgi:hypothetical protein